MNTDCRRCEDVNAFLAGELSREEQAEFEMHLTACAECRAAVESTRRVIGRLRALPQVETAPDLAPLILARLPKRPRWSRIGAIAAAVALFAGGAVVVSVKDTAKPAASLTDKSGVPVTLALDWFCQNQEPDGSWNAEKWGGNGRFEIALTALPILALLSADSPTPQHTSAVNRATRWLQEQQDETGSFGPEFQGRPYNQCLATLALLRAYERQSDAELKRTLDAAVAQLVTRQTAAGGWGYLYSPFADRSITEWHIEAIELAGDLGWENVRDPLRRGRSWLAAHSDPHTDPEEPRDSPSALLAHDESVTTNNAALDFYRVYFLTAALRREHNESSRQRLAVLRHELILHQASDGIDVGSWPADDRWGRVGGRLYSTALASLSLRGR